MREFHEVYDEGETCPKCLDATAKAIHIELQEALAEVERLRRIEEAAGRALADLKADPKYGKFRDNMLSAHAINTLECALRGEP